MTGNIVADMRHKPSDSELAAITIQYKLLLDTLLDPRGTNLDPLQVKVAFQAIREQRIRIIPRPRTMELTESPWDDWSNLELVPLTAIKLGDPTRKALGSLGITTVGQLTRHSVHSFRVKDPSRRISGRMHTQIRSALAEHGLALSETARGLTLSEALHNGASMDYISRSKADMLSMLAELSKDGYTTLGEMADKRNQVHISERVYRHSPRSGGPSRNSADHLLYAYKLFPIDEYKAYCREQNQREADLARAKQQEHDAYYFPALPDHAIDPAIGVYETP